MAATTTQVRERIETYGIAAAFGVGVVAGVVYYIVHEVFHMLLGVGPLIDGIGSIALGAVAAVGVWTLDWNLRVVVAAFIGLFVTHTLVMGYFGVLSFSNFSWSMPVAVVAGVVFFVAAGGLTTPE